MTDWTTPGFPLASTTSPPRRSGDETMRAVAFDEFGGPEVLRVVELPVPAPTGKQALVRVHAASVNPTDTIFRSGQGYARTVGRPAPWVPGMDFAGLVEAVGRGSRWSTGDRVFGVAMPAGTRQGAYADFVVAPDDALAPAPPELTAPEASTLAMNGLTALRVLDWLNAGGVASIAVTGAAGAVGTMVIELARQRGLHVVADAAASDRDAVRSAGANLVLPRGEAWPGTVARAYPGGLDAVVDAGLCGSAVFSVVRSGGYAALLRPGQEHSPPRGIVTHTIAMTDYYRNADKLREIANAARTGILTARVAEVLRPTEVVRAHELLERGGIRGRIVLDFSDGNDS